MPRFSDTIDVESSYQAQALDILPHVALPLALVLSLFCPPIRARASIFVTLIVLLDYACISSPWPPNEGVTRPLRYSATGSWFFVLPVVEKLLLHAPEREFWRTDDPQGPSGTGPQELGWEKLRWAAALVATPRAVGWNFGGRRVDARREAVRKRGHTKASFMAVRLFRAFVMYLLLDAVLFAARRAVIPAQWAWDVLTISRIAYLELLMAVSVYAIMSMQFEITGIVGVGLFQNLPEDWPPLFGSLFECYTVANVWGEFWHGYIQQPALGFSHRMVALLKLPRRSTSAYLVHLATAFLVSAFFHILSVSVVSPGYLTLEELVTDMTAFFIAQPLAAIAEKVLIDTYTQTIRNKRSPQVDAARTSLPSVSHRLMGYVWVVTWFVFSGWWFVKPYAAVGIMEWPLPFSFFESVP